VGKTNVVVNLGIVLSHLGQKVLILDANMGFGNLDILLGLNPWYNLNHILNEEKTLSDIFLHGPEGVMILPSSSGGQELTELTNE